MRQQTIATARIAATRQSTAETSCKGHALLIPSDRAALCIVEAHGACTRHILAAWIVMHLRAGTDAISSPSRIGTAALEGERHARLIPCVAAARWPFKADRIATRWIDAAWGCMHRKRRSCAWASAHRDADKRRQIRARLIPHDSAAVRLDGTDRCSTLHIRATSLRVRLKAITSAAASPRGQLAAEAESCIGERLLHTDGIPYLHTAEWVERADLLAACAVTASLQETRYKAGSSIV